MRKGPGDEPAHGTLSTLGLDLCFPLPHLRVPGPFPQPARGPLTASPRGITPPRLRPCPPTCVFQSSSPMTPEGLSYELPLQQAEMDDVITTRRTVPALVAAPGGWQFVVGGGGRGPMVSGAAGAALPMRPCTMGSHSMGAVLLLPFPAPPNPHLIHTLPLTQHVLHALRHGVHD